MMKHSFSRWLVVSAVVGLAVPIAFFVAREVISSSNTMDSITLIAWPSSFFMMATDGEPAWTATYNYFLAMSVLANILLYSAVGSILWRIKWGIARIRTALPRR